ncbi:hypothetical protein [Aquimarina aquimarini]|uniref:hypothetical protein n=1 Tax=Aquimarina aquimarini TaxID=1191734 RepID=UPI000D55ABF3|nr:hypothetical protein [Aquimarina aquimarini]
MKKKLLYFILFAPTLLIAQLPKSMIVESKRSYFFEEYEGSPYLKDRYVAYDVINEKTGTFTGKLKYNIDLDAFEYKDGSKFYQIIKEAEIHIRNEDHFFYYCHFVSPRGSKREGYYVLLELHDQYRMYKRYTLDITEPEKSSGSTYGVEPGEIKQICTYYLEENGVIAELSQNEKDILELFSDKRIELAAYLKKEKLRLKKEEDLVRFIAKYNALKQSDNTTNKSLISKRQEE